MLFSHICDLLEHLSAIKTRFPPYLPRDAERKSSEVIVEWFRSHRARINHGTDIEALFSTLLPERRTDRVYSLREQSLEKIIGRVLGLSSGRRDDLARYKEPGAGDLADCVERVQKQAEMPKPPRGNEVTVEEVDGILLTMASYNRFSSPCVKALAPPDVELDVNYLLSYIVYRLRARDSKWLIRIILKNLAPVKLPEHLIFKSYHGLLPMLLKVQSELPAALRLLQAWKTSCVGETDPLQRFRPIIGVKVGRQEFLKARSIKHCMDMAQGRRISIEKKYDGEYCQIHIDMSKTPDQQIKIFSKSGKDSTTDRIRVHSAIRRCLRLDESSCTIRRGCILEGELLVYSDKYQQIAEFHKIRKHVKRSGSYIGTDQDSQRHDYEHLMVVFFDILMLDDRQVLSMKQIDRRSLLQETVKCTVGRAQIAESQLVTCSSRAAAKELREIFTKSIIAHEEGLIAKPADEPYFNFDGGSGYKSCCIKLKKEYVSSFGDVGDFAVVGASYDPVTAKEYKLSKPKWTHFWIACLDNKEAVVRWNERPRFVVITIVSPNATILKSLINYANPDPVPVMENKVFDIRIEKGIARGRQLSTVFTTPPVFDMRCFSFDKEGDTGFWTLRFPLVSKLHFDRSYLDTISFAELQDMAEKASTIDVIKHSQDELQWIQRLEAADPGGIAVDASTQRTTQRSTPSPQTTPAKSSPLRIGLSQRPSVTINSEVHVLGKRKLGSDPSYANAPSKRQAVNKASQAVQMPLSRPSCTAHISSSLASCPSDGVSDNLTARSSQPLADITNVNSLAQRSNVIDEETLKSATRAVSYVHTAIDKTVPISTPPDGIENSLFTPPDTAKRATIRTITTAFKPSNIPGPTRTIPKTPHLPMMTTTNTCGTCRVPMACSLSKYVFYLSPCIANMPFLTQNLLSPHAVFFTSNISTWLSNLNEASQSPHSQTRTPFRRIFLVERRRKAETRQALKDLARKLAEVGNKHEKLIEVYDWRLIEAVIKLENGDSPSFNPWRRYWVGVIS